jgi:hypothetical protein
MSTPALRAPAADKADGGGERSRARPFCSQHCDRRSRLCRGSCISLTPPPPPSSAPPTPPAPHTASPATRHAARPPPALPPPGPAPRAPWGNGVARHGRAGIAAASRGADVGGAGNAPLRLRHASSRPRPAPPPPGRAHARSARHSPTAGGKAAGERARQADLTSLSDMERSAHATSPPPTGQRLRRRRQDQILPYGAGPSLPPSGLALPLYLCYHTTERIMADKPWHCKGYLQSLH